MKFMLLTIFFGAQSAFCAHTKQSQVVVVEKHVTSKKKSYDGPPLYISDIYTDGKPDRDRDKLLINLQKTFPILSISEIEACINYCCSLGERTDIIQECQDLQLWKAAHAEELSNNNRRYESCFPEFCFRRD